MTAMLEKILDIIILGWDYVKPYVVLDEFEGGGVLRLGRYNRTLGPGFHWKWPCFERVWEVTTCETTLRLEPQTLTSKDGRAVVVGGIVKYEIKNVKPFICDIWDQKDVLADVAMGAIQEVVTDTEYETLVATPPRKKVLDAIRSEVNQYGFKVNRFTFTDLAATMSLRLIQPRAKDLDN